MDLNKKNIVLTGASGGIGSAVAARLVLEGATLILVGRQRVKLSSLNQQLGGGHYCVEADITSEVGLSQLLACCRQVKGGIDMVINCAGLSAFAQLESMTSDSIRNMMAVNVCGAILVCQTLLPLLKEQRQQASIINVGSTFGSIGYPGFSVYCASKFALRGFTEALRRELADTNIDVRYFAPRATKTTLNSPQVVEMNLALGTTMDSSKSVAKALVLFIKKRHRAQYYMGWPEALFVRLNGVFPSWVEQGIVKQLPIIKRFL